MENYLITKYNLDNLLFTKPKKYGDFMISKIKYSEIGDMLIQFPKMILTSQTDKIMEVEFTNENGYSIETYNFLAKLDITFVVFSLLVITNIFCCGL